jgi:hypothetical protein
MIVAIRLTENERKLANNYAQRHSLSLFAVGQEACEDYITDEKKSRPVTDLWKECAL